jgi:hypothetical protein
MPAACSNFPDWNYFNGSGLKKSWLRGLDLNQRPSGYEREGLSPLDFFFISFHGF